MKFRYSLRTLLVLVTGLSICIIAPYWIPKHRTLTVHKSCVGYYRGLGLTDGKGYFGTHWYRIVVNEEPEGYWEVDVNGLGYAPYRGYYATGVLREVGTCLVEKNGNDIAPDRHILRDAQYFDPDGNLVSEVKDGTGRQVLCYSNGQPSWELVLEDGVRVSVRQWHRNGQLAYELKYLAGLPHGPSTSYYPNGAVRCSAHYSNGKRVGLWRDFAADGGLEQERDYRESVSKSSETSDGT